MNIVCHSLGNVLVGKKKLLLDCVPNANGKYAVQMNMVQIHTVFELEECVVLSNID